eukprot:TRINITY_DN1388_c0_g1_i4.p1 TRINITY_DN1388_c0_g1~~TRINITY_DN1388_c0_g1_i4.p1  ORF type:complete len:244 (+),score=20.03 TRINITY_DN1388_c0_g1_i4:126-857(+)
MLKFFKSMEPKRELVPLEKISHNIKLALEKCEPDMIKYEKFAVLICTGSFSPVHVMHLQIFKLARKFLESKNIHVVGGFISPSHDRYVSNKLLKDAIRAEHRIKMCQLVCAQEDWLDVSTWECAQPGFTNFPSVVRFHGSVLASHFPDINIELYYVCGADLAVNCFLNRGLGGLKVITVRRHGVDNSDVDELIRTGVDGYFYVVESDSLIPVSSTEIRRRVKSKEPLDDLMNKEASDYLRKIV